MYQRSSVSQVKSQKQMADSGLAEKCRPNYLRFHADLGMLKINMLSIVTGPRLSELDRPETTSDNLGEDWDGDETS
jgi:hypothetical protein